MSVTLRLVCLPGGTLQIFVDSGSFEEAKRATELVLTRLQTSGLPVTQIGLVEQHRDDVSHVHLHPAVDHHIDQEQ